MHKYSKFGKCHYMRGKYAIAHFCKICEIYKPVSLCKQPHHLIHCNETALSEVVFV